jgi:quinol monooxygenase YgiN
MANHSPLTALVEYEVRVENSDVGQWLDVWQARGQDALFGEPETLAYEAMQSQQNADQILVFERYKNGQSSLDAHIARTAHATLIETMGSRNMTRRRVMSNLFSDIDDYGWWSRDTGADPMQEAGIIVTLIGTHFDDEAMKQRYIEVTGDHANYCFVAEPDTLIYNGCLAMRDSDRGPDIKTGDLLFVAAFKNQAAAIKHRDDPRHLKLQPVLEGIARERRFALTYLTTGRGFLWRE